MMTRLKSILVATGLATALVTSSAAFADKWNMPVRSNERNYFTRNIMQFAEDADLDLAGLHCALHLRLLRQRVLGVNDDLDFAVGRPLAAVLTTALALFAQRALEG
jgi:hypothetical protein